MAEKKPEPDCLGAAGCSRAAADTHKRAAEEAQERRAELAQIRQSTKRARESTITAAEGILDTWGQSLQRNPKAPAEERQRFRNDQQIVQQVRAANDPSARSSVSDETIGRVTDVSIQSDLILHANAKDLEGTIAVEDKRFSMEQKQFEGMYTQNSGRADALGSVTAPKATAPLKSAVTQPSETGTVFSRDGRGELDISKAKEQTQSAVSERVSAKLASAVSISGEDPRKPVVRGSKDRVQALRDSLRAKIGQGEPEGVAGLDKDALEGASFSKGLNGEEQAAAAAGQVRYASAAQAAEAVAKQSSYHAGDGARDFGQLLKDAGIDRGPAGISGDGLLGLESPDLFERVRHAHRSCLARECVTNLRP